MSDSSRVNPLWPSDQLFDPDTSGCHYFQEIPPLPVSLRFPPQAHLQLTHQSPAQQLSKPVTLLLSPPKEHIPSPQQRNSSPPHQLSPAPRTTFYENASDHRGENPRLLRNKAEKQRRDRLNRSITQLAKMVPTVVASNKKIDKTGVLRLTAHYLRSHQHVFGNVIQSSGPQFSPESIRYVLSLFNGFLLTVTYRGLVVVVSANVKQYLGYSELDLLGQNVFSIVHFEDIPILHSNLMPPSCLLGRNGELVLPENLQDKENALLMLASPRQFIVRFKRYGSRSDPEKYVTCIVSGTFRISDRAASGNRRCSRVRRARARSENTYSSGNDIVFIGTVRPMAETFQTESAMEEFSLEYRTRHSVDGEIIQCEYRISLVTGYMMDEVYGLNAMNFMHRDDVHFVIVALREMYDEHRLYGESCYRLMTRNGQFIYMRTKGRLDVDAGSGAVRTFVCTNTVVDEAEGKHLIQLMKSKFNLAVANETCDTEDINGSTDEDTSVSVEHPKQLGKIILDLVTNLPSPQSERSQPAFGETQNLPLAFIAPERDRILHAIDKIYTVIKTFAPEPEIQIDKSEMEKREESNRGEETEESTCEVESECEEDQVGKPPASYYPDQRYYVPPPTQWAHTPYLIQPDYQPNTEYPTYSYYHPYVVQPTYYGPPFHYRSQRPFPSPYSSAYQQVPESSQNCYQSTATGTSTYQTEMLSAESQPAEKPVGRPDSPNLYLAYPLPEMSSQLTTMDSDNFQRRSYFGGPQETDWVEHLVDPGLVPTRVLPEEASEELEDIDPVRMENIIDVRFWSDSPSNTMIDRIEEMEK